MKTRKILGVVLCVVMILGAFAGCGQKEEPLVGGEMRVGVLKGPTGIGASYLMDKSDKGETINTYTFSIAAAPTDLVGAFTQGELDVIALPTNVAASLYQKTEGKVQIVAVNTLSVLYILENGETVNSIKDLEGKTIYANGQGANPEYILNYLLKANGLTPGENVTVEFKTPDEIVALMATEDGAICMLPVPNVTAVMMKNANTRIAVDLAEAWNEVTTEGQITTGCLVVRKEYAEQNPDAMKTFLAEYKESTEYVTANPKEASELVAKYEITGSAAIAEAAIPKCNIVCITGDEMKPALDGYYKVLFDADPTSIGGAIPDDGFYFK